MTTEKLGAKIKALRKAKEKTQSELAGSFITRNMLSRVESGTVTPSLDTLCYLAKELDISPGTLLDDAVSVSEALAEQLLADMRRLMQDGETKKAAALYEKNSDLLSDAHALYLSCCLRLGCDAYQRGCLKTARTWFEKAGAEECDSFCASVCSGYLALIAAVIDEEPPRFDEKNEALPFFFTLMQYFSSETGEITRALHLYRDGYYREAEKILITCLREQKSAQDPMCRLFLYRMLQACAVQLNDFEAAYQYLSKLNEQRANYRK